MNADKRGARLRWKKNRARFGPIDEAGFCLYEARLVYVDGRHWWRIYHCKHGLHQGRVADGWARTDRVAKRCVLALARAYNVLR